MKWFSLAGLPSDLLTSFSVGARRLKIALPDASRVSGLATWYQGPLSTETPLE